MTRKQFIIFLLSIAVLFVIFIFNFRFSPLKNFIVPLRTPKAHVSPAEITHGDISKKEIIFTFDAGGTIQSGDKILEVLAKHHVKSTFFLTGKMVEDNPDFAKRIVAA